MKKGPHHQSIKKIWKLKGKEKLKFYCQMCQKQCRDEHGFKCHCSSEGHMRQMILFAENQEHYINAHSQEFHQEFLQIIKRYKEYADSNVLYQEYSSHHDHMHLNATRWATLTDYVMYLKEEGICKVQERENGSLFIKYALAESDQKIIKPKIIKEKDEEEREREQLNEQIERAFQNVKHDEKKFEELKEEREVISLKIKPLVVKKLKKSVLLK